MELAQDHVSGFGLTFGGQCNPKTASHGCSYFHFIRMSSARDTYKGMRSIQSGIYREIVCTEGDIDSNLTLENITSMGGDIHCSGDQKIMAGSQS